MRPTPLFLVLLSGLAASHPSEDMRYMNCDPDLTSLWPEDLRDEQLLHPANAKPDMSGPYFKLYSQVDVRNIEGDKTYIFELSRLTSEPKFQRLLISIESANPDGSQQFDLGELKSLSDFTEHLSYRCSRYLVERSLDIGTEVSIPFAWQAPKEGCIEISAQVLDTYYGFYSKENDFFSALKLVACVDPALTPKTLTNEIQNEEGTLESNDDDNSQVETFVSDEKAVTDQQNDESSKNESEDDDFAEILPAAEALIGDVKDDKELDNTNERKQKKGSKSSKKSKISKKDERRKGKKLCCQIGLEAKDACDSVSTSVLDEAQNAFGLKSQNCKRVYKICCEDKKIGAKKLKKLSKNDSGSTDKKSEKKVKEKN